MTPAARIGAAIEILDRILAGAPAEKTLTGWARSNRYAGSGDRAAIRDHVFDAVRCRSSFTALAGASAPSGRALMIGALRAQNIAPESVFSGTGYAPAQLSDSEKAGIEAALDLSDLPEHIALDCPSWLEQQFRHALGPDFAPVLATMRMRAPVILRANAASGTREDVRAALVLESIASVPHPLASYALQVTENAQKIRQSKVFADGRVELQDAAPQAAVEALPLRRGMRVLDYCAGGGGKSLAIAALLKGSVVAHDANAGRMRDLPARAARAGQSIEIVDTADLQTNDFDMVVVDVPCSGSGTWRRSPDAKWTLTETRLAELRRLQAEILDTAKRYVTADGYLAYMTCSLLDAENRDQIEAFLSRDRGWRVVEDRRYSPLEGGDGFYSALLTRV